MINHLEINKFEFTADNRAYADISGLEPTDVAVNLITAGGYKKIAGFTRDNRIIQITGVVSDVSFIRDVYSHLMVGNKYKIKVSTDYTDEFFYTDGIVTDISVERYKLPVTYTIKITCESSFLFGEEMTYGGSEASTIIFEDKFNIPQDSIKVTHTIGANENEFTLNFFGTTVVKLNSEYEGQELVLNLEKQTCSINGVNCFHLVTSWADGSWAESFSIPANTTILFKEKVLGVF